MPQVSNAPSDFPGATSDQPKVEAERASDTAEQQDALGMASNPESLPTMRATTTTTKTTIIVPAAELLPVAESAPLVLKKAAVPAAAAQLSQSPLLRKIRDGAPPFDAATPTCDIAAYPMPSIESGLPWVHDAFAVDAVLTKKRKNNNLPSKIRRFCICKVWQQGMQRKPICGVCVLKHILATMREGHRGRVFPEVQVKDIKIMKDIAIKIHLGAITWHGLRRGRTDDICNGLDNPFNPSASIEDIAESLGHKLGRASFFSYIKKDSASKQHFGRHLAAQSDSD